MSYLACCCGILNESRYMKQWVDFQIIQGFEKIYVYNNGSTDNFREVLDPYVRSGLVDIIDIPQNIKQTITNFHWCFDDCFRRIRLKHKFFFHHSIDEYIYNQLDPTKTVADTLKDYEQYSGVVLPWKIFNSDNQEKKTDGLVIERFHSWVMDRDCHIKTIINVDKTRNHVGNPHSFFYKEGFAVHGDGVRQDYGEHNGAMQKRHYPVLTVPLVINHYAMMSKEEFDEKMNKGRSDLIGAEQKRRDGADEYWNYYNSPDRVWNQCHDLERYIDMLHLM